VEYRVWQFASANGRIVALFRDKTIDRELQEWSQRSLPKRRARRVAAARIEADAPDFLPRAAAGDRLPGWQIRLAWDDEQLVNATARGKIAPICWPVCWRGTASGCTVDRAAGFLRQMRIDAAEERSGATVSHELKTPLASIRLLVDYAIERLSRGKLWCGRLAALAAGTAAPQNDPRQVRGDGGGCRAKWLRIRKRSIDNLLRPLPVAKSAE